MATEYAFTVNGKPRRIATAAARTLLEVLREDLDLTGCKYGCGEGECRSCTVLIDGRPRASCQIPMSDMAGREVLTIEGLSEDGELHPVQEAFIGEQAMQCGYCVPGMVLTAVALLRRNPRPGDAQIVEWMNGNICRCCNYPNLINAVRRAASRTAGAPPA